ncbi:OTU domain-containing protein 4 [Microdochium nivale]|nr:OTU domain-containing protein 4 [Microdochium nivale]
MLCNHAWPKPGGQSLYEICENHARRHRQQQQQHAQHRNRRGRQGRQQQRQSGDRGDYNSIIIRGGQPRHGRTLTQSSISSFAVTSDDEDGAVATANGENSANSSNRSDDKMKEAMARIVDLLGAEDKDLKGLEKYACVFAVRQGREEAEKTQKTQKQEDEEEMKSHQHATPHTSDIDHTETETKATTAEKSTSRTTAETLTSVSSIAISECSTTPATSTSTDHPFIIAPKATGTRAAPLLDSPHRDVGEISPNAGDLTDTRNNTLQAIQPGSEQEAAVAAIKSVSLSQSARAAVSPDPWSRHELDGFLFFLWTASRGDQIPLAGCKPYTFRLPLPHLDWKQCIGTEQDVQQVEILLGYSDVRMQMRSGVEKSCHLADGSVDQKSNMAELVVYPTIRADFGGKVAPGTVFRLNQAYNLCLDGYYNELHTRKCNVRLVDYMQERFELMNQAVRMATLAHKTGSQMCKVAGNGEQE